MRRAPVYVGDVDEGEDEDICPCEPRGDVVEYKVLVRKIVLRGRA